MRLKLLFAISSRYVVFVVFRKWLVISIFIWVISPVTDASARDANLVYTIIEFRVSATKQNSVHDLCDMLYKRQTTST